MIKTVYELTRLDEIKEGDYVDLYTKGKGTVICVITSSTCTFVQIDSFKAIQEESNCRIPRLVKE